MRTRYNRRKRRTYKDTSCFHTGLCDDKRPKSPCAADRGFIGDGALLEDDRDDEGDVFVLDFPGGRDTAMALSAVRAFEEEVLDRAIAVPFTSLSISSAGSRLTNSFCSNWTTTYGRACIDVTLSPRADMSLTWICPLDVADGPGGCDALGVALEDALVEVVDGDGDGVLDVFSMESES
jgi:hypothetical protein